MNYNEGNSIGETNIDLLKQVLEAKGHEDVLGNLSDDEGEGEDDERDGDSESDENDEPSEEVPVAGVASEDSLHEDTSFTAPQPSPVSVAIIDGVVKLCV